MISKEMISRLLLNNEEDARACRDIPESACREIPRNSLLMLVSQTLTTLGDLLINPKTVLAWLMGAVGASWLVAWLVPIRESLSMLPQIMIGAWVRRKPIRKYFWVVGSLGQGVGVLGMAASVWWLRGFEAGISILVCLVIFSLARGFCSVAQKDVLGKTIPKGKRGRLTGIAATISGVVVVLLSLTLFRNQVEPSLMYYVALLLAASFLWLVAGWIFANIDEYAGETGGGVNALREALGNLRLVRDDQTFRRFVTARGMLLSSALAAPYLVLLAQEQTSGAWLLGVFMIASSLGSALSAFFWGLLADQSSRMVMLIGGTVASIICIATGALGMMNDVGDTFVWLYPISFFLLSIAHAGVRIGRKTYLVDVADGNKRTDYTAVSNTLIGILLLIFGGLTALIAVLSVEIVIIFLGTMALCGSLMTFQLPEV